MRYIFGECTLDMQRDALRRAGRVSRRRRNAFQVLAYLLAHPTESSPSRSCANRSGRSSSSAMQRWRVRSKPCASRFGKAPGLNVSSNLSTAMTIAGLWRWRPTPMPGPTSPTRPARRRRRAGGRNTPTCQCRRRSGEPSAIDLVWPKLWRGPNGVASDIVGTQGCMRRS
jgi:hypothetical protein